MKTTSKQATTLFDSFMYGINGKLTEESKVELASFILDNLPGRNQDGIINMTYDSEYDMLDIKIFKEK